MNRFRAITLVLFLLFTTTGIKSTPQKDKLLPVNNRTHQYTFDEFNKLEEAINKQIKLKQTLDSLKLK